ncbi:MAG: hypothetical protein DRG78_01175 [Epsilonproteobacteria bacterium]|nr:MAG: hypothetical protein DRG78_01175 [Campylobacterota bacterium]
MFWNKPQKVIKSLLYYLSIVSILISAISIIVFMIWTNEPTYIDKIDKKITQDYLQSYILEYERANKLFKDDKHEKALVLLENLYDRMESFKKVNRLFYLKKKVMIKLIDNYIENNNIDKALIISKNWSNLDDRDLDEKLYAIKILKIMDIEKAEKEYDKLFKKFYNVQKVVDSYSLFLIDINKFRKLENIISTYKINTKLKFQNYKKKYQLFLDDDTKDFNEKDSIVLLKDTKISDTIYEVSFNSKIKNLKALRFDIDRSLKFKISDIKIDVIVNNKIYNLSNNNIFQINQLTKIDKNSYISKNINDPFFVYSVNSEIKNINTDVEIRIKFKIESAEPRIDLTDKLIQLFIDDKNRTFIEQDSEKIFIFKFKNKYFVKLNKIDLDKAKALRLDFDHNIGLTLKNIEVFLYAKNKMNKLIKSNISVFNDIDKSTLTIEGSDPFIIFNIDNLNDIKYKDLYIKYEVIQ